MRVLLIEESLTIAKTLARLLSDEPGMRVIATAADIITAVPLIIDTAPDVVAMGIDYTGAAGMEAVSLIRSRHGSLPIILFSLPPVVDEKNVIAYGSKPSKLPPILMISSNASEDTRALQPLVRKLGLCGMQVRFLSLAMDNEIGPGLHACRH